MHEENLAHDDYALAAKELQATKEGDEKVQEILNHLFPAERRENLLALQPKDAKGRRVRYYRSIEIAFLLEMLKKGTLTAYNYFDPQVERHQQYKSLEEQVSDEDLYSVLASCVDAKYAINSDYENQNKELEQLKNAVYFDNTQLFEIVAALFPQASREEVTSTFSNPTFGKVVTFFDRYLSIETARVMHTGSVDQKFSPLLSASVGGVISLDFALHKRYGSIKVYIEFVDPNQEMIPHPEGIVDEKEVFLRALVLAK